MAVTPDTPKATLRINVPWKVQLVTPDPAQDATLLEQARMTPEQVTLAQQVQALKTLQQIHTLPADDPRHMLVFGWWPWVLHNLSTFAARRP